jgi:valyl-tRNA synthetase
VAEGDIQLFPERWVGVYENWMSNIRDWCISRQLWWGHRIPVWYCGDCEEEIAARTEPDICPACGGEHLAQEEDVLDTWFSSWLWTFSPLGWPDETADLEKFHPTSVLVTAPDIIFFWVARMIMASYEFKGEKPFGEVLFHGIVRDEEGRKMSKSLGNSPDPIHLIDEYGADALRCSLVMLTPTGQDIFFSESTLEVGRNFCNKIFQATKLVLGAWDQAGLAPSDPDAQAPRTLDIGDLGTAGDWTKRPAGLFAELWSGVLGGKPPAELIDSDLKLEDRWVIGRLLETVAGCDANMGKRRLNDAAYGVFNFFRHEYCDWYLEAVKPRLRGTQDRGPALAVAVLCLAVSYKLLHPMMPFITEELWSWLPPARGFLMSSSFPRYTRETPFLQECGLFSQVMKIVGVIRNMRNELGVQPGKRGRAILRAPTTKESVELEAGLSLIALLAKMETVEVVTGGEDPSPAGAGVAGSVEVFLPMEGLVDLEKERARLAKELVGIENWMKGCRAKLGNEKFTANAPEHVVQKQRDLLAENELKAGKLKELLAALG